jgi:hypothetical protein
LRLLSLNLLGLFCCLLPWLAYAPFQPLPPRERRRRGAERLCLGELDTNIDSVILRACGPAFPAVFWSLPCCAIFLFGSCTCAVVQSAQAAMRDRSLWNWAMIALAGYARELCNRSNLSLLLPTNLSFYASGSNRQLLVSHFEPSAR